MSSRATYSIDGVTGSLVVLSSLVTAAGAAIVIGPGYLNPLRFGPYFIAIGTACFFVPGLLGIVGGLFLRRERARWAWMAALASVTLQLIVASGGFIAQFFFSPLSAVPLVVCAAWAIASAILLRRLTRLAGAMRSDADAHRGFVIDVKPPT